MHDPVQQTQPTDPPLAVMVDQVRPDLVLLRLTGDLDMLTAPVLHERLEPLLSGPGPNLLVDLDGVGFLGSAGLAELAWANDEAGKQGIKIGLVVGSRVVL